MKVKFEDITQSLDSKNQADAQIYKEKSQLQSIISSQDLLRQTIDSAIGKLIDFEAKHEPNVSVKNHPSFPDSIKTPDIKEVVDALNSLKDTTVETKPDDTKQINALVNLEKAIKELPSKIIIPKYPEPLKEININNQPDYNKSFSSLESAIKSIDVKPVINIPEDKPDDYTPIIESLIEVISAVKGIKIPEVKFDIKSLVTAMNSVQTSIEALRFPVPNYVLPFKDSSGKATQARVNDSGALVLGGKLVPENYNYINASYPDSVTEVYTYKNGGASGVIMATITVIYTTSTKSLISSVART